MRVQNQPAFVIRTQPYSETSLLIEVLSQDYGRLGVLGKGVRRLKSRARGLVTPFQPLLVGWSGRGELPVLSSTEASGRAMSLHGNSLLCGFYVNELLLRLLHRNDPHPELFQAYQRGIRGLVVENNPETPLRLFEKDLLKELGYGLVLDHEVEKHTPIEPDLCYNYILDRGPVLARDGVTNSLAVQGSTLLQLGQDRLLNERSLQESKALLRAVLARHLDGRPLHSRKLIQRMNKDMISLHPRSQDSVRH